MESSSRTGTDLTPPDDLARRAAELRAAQPRWQARAPGERQRILHTFADRLDRPDLVAALARDTAHRRLAEKEVRDSAALIRHWADLAPVLLRDAAGEALHPSVAAPGLSWGEQLLPCPLAGFLTPANFPLTMALIDAAPALAAGCAVLVKPSEHVPHFLSPLAAAVAETPELAEVTGLVRGDTATGRDIVRHVDHIVFTGSVAAGREVAVAAAQRLIPATLELGGKDPAIVLAGADLQRAATAILRTAIENSGQSCLAIERVYVEEPVADAFEALLVRKAGAIRLQSAAGQGGHIAPLLRRRQGETLRAQIADAKAKGARILLGGAPAGDDPRHWPVTIVAGATHDMRIMQEESFGPILALMRVASCDEAVARANDSLYGLSGAVFAATAAEGLAVARRMRVGAVSVDDCGLTTRTAEPERHAFGVSALGGSRTGAAAILRFLRHKALIVQGGQPDGLDTLTDGPPSQSGPLDV